MRATSGLAHIAAIALCSLAATETLAQDANQLIFGGTTASTLAEQASSPSLVPVKIGLMSRCPDFISFAAQFSRALPKVWSLIDLHYAYIGTQNHSAPYGASCKHGDIECAGNVHELCVNDHLRSNKKISSVEAQRTTWDFIECLNYGGIADIGKEDAARNCLSAVHGPRWEEDGIKRCAKGQLGRKLLAKSLQDAHKSDIVNSATLQIDGNTICVRDGGEWKQCTGGHEPTDWVRAIEDAYRARNPFVVLPTDSFSRSVEGNNDPFQATPPTHVLQKRQSASNPPPPPPPSNSQNPFNNDGQRTTPLSVFTFVIGELPCRFCVLRRMGTWTASRDGPPVQKRQVSGSTTLFGDGSSVPTPFLIFGVSAIALFVLVVAFVLLRIFVRNRRLRRLGLLPEGGPMERYFGGALGVPEDTLVPPKLWEASIVDVRDGAAGRGAASGSLTAGGDKSHGWDALMPISAALPTNICTSLTHGEKPAGPQTPAAQDAAAQSQPAPQGLGRRLGLFRRTTADEAVGSGTGELPGDTASASDDKAPDDRIPINVNVTVLIAMPSPQTVFPHRGMRSAALPLRSPASQATFKTATLGATHPVNETEEDERNGEEKGKTRALHRAPSISSVATRKSVREARREAFFGELPPDAADQAEAEVELVRGATDKADEALHDDEEEELPELVFGTTSVPVYSRIGPSAPQASGAPLSFGHQYLQTPASELDHPHRKDLLDLIRRARAAQESKERAEAAKRAAEAAKQAEDTNAANRASAAPTGDDARISLANTSIDANVTGPPEADLSSGRPPLDDILVRAHQPRPSTASTDVGPNGFMYEQAARPSFGLAEANGRRHSSRTVDPLLNSRPSTSTAERPLNDGRDAMAAESSVSLADHPLSTDSPIPATPGAETLPRTSTSTWHTGVTGPRSEAPQHVVDDDDDGDDDDTALRQAARDQSELSKRLEQSHAA